LSFFATVTRQPSALAHGILVADDEGGLHFVAEFGEAVVGEPAEDESDGAFFEGVGDVGDALREECIVAKIGRRKRAWSEKDDDGLAESVGSIDGDIEGRVVAAALSALHPVNHAGTVGVGGSSAADGYARIVGEFEKSVHVLRVRKLSAVGPSDR
jgi:hypothetical protein